jgi:hypothetical protein
VTIDDNLVVNGGVNAIELYTSGDIRCDSGVLTNTIVANGADQVTIGDNLTVTGNLSVQGSINYNPFWVAGVFNGVTLTKLHDQGRYPFTVTRIAGAAGAYAISWVESHQRGDNITIHATAEFGLAYLRRREDTPITATGFGIIVRDVANISTLVDRIVHISVYT